MVDQPAAAQGGAADAARDPSGWVRRPWCVRLAVAILLASAAFNLLYLFNNCPLDLSEDECQYWEWSRHLDYGYYSKPPGIAWTIRAAVAVAHACGVPDDGVALMPWVRLPAVVFSLVTGFTLLALARRVFRDDRAGLALVLLSGAAPVFAVGSLLITIDAPMYMLWTLSVYCLWRHMDDGTPNAGRGTMNVEPGETGRPIQRSASGVRRLYLAAVFCSLGLLFKHIPVAIPISAAVAAAFSPRIRARLKTVHVIPALVIVLASQIPVLVWNASHNWVTFKHMGGQAGFGGGGGEVKTFAAKLLAAFARLGEYVAGQAGVLGGLLFVFMLNAVVDATRRTGAVRRVKGWIGRVIDTIRRRRHATPTGGPGAPHLTFLLSFLLPLWLFYAFLALRTNTEPNWPAAAYATGMVLLAGFAVANWNHPLPRPRKVWRNLLAGTVICGFLFTALAFNLHRIYPLLVGPDAPLDKFPHPRKWDPSANKLRGHRERAAAVEAARRRFLAELPPAADVRVVATRYDVAASLAFYLPGQPFVGSIASRTGARMSQYDLWPPLEPPASTDPARPTHVLLVGTLPPIFVNSVLVPAFDHIDRLPDGTPNFQLLKTTYHGVTIREVYVLRCYGFKGWPPLESPTHF